MVEWGVKKGFRRGARKLTSEIIDRFKGSIVKSNMAYDEAAHKLAKKLKGEAQVEFSTFKNVEFDAISKEYVGQAKPGLQSISKKFRKQAKNTFEAAKSTGRKVYYEFETKPAEDVISKLKEYSLEYDVELTIEILK